MFNSDLKGAKWDKAVGHYLDHMGFKVVSNDEEAMLINDKDELALVFNDGVRPDRDMFEQKLIDLLPYVEPRYSNMRVRLDVLEGVTLGEDKAIIRHHVNAGVVEE